MARYHACSEGCTLGNDHLGCCIVPLSDKEQPMPTVNDGPCIQDLVMADIETRKKIGIERYGTVLQPFNGRDALRDAYEESLDQTIYLKQVLVERDTLNPPKK